MKLLLVGFGHVGRTLVEVLILERNKFPGLAGFSFSITGIATKNHGIILNPGKKDLHRLIYGNAELRISEQTTDAEVISETIRLIHEADYDVLVEMSPLSISGKGNPALVYVREALSRGKHVVSANKGPVAFAYEELHNLALKNRAFFLFEATVMDGAPVFNMMRETLKGCRIKQISGLLNSTTNFILSSLENGMTYESALSEARKKGFAENDPSHDLEGWDAAAKISTLANVFLNARLTPFDVSRDGISHISPETVRKSLSNGFCIRLVARAWMETSGHVKATVKPEEIDFRDSFSSVRGTGACLKIWTDMMDPISIFQANPTLRDTAFGIITDLLSIVKAKSG